MPISIKQLREKKASVDVYGDGNLNVEYYLHIDQNAEQIRLLIAMQAKKDELGMFDNLVQLLPQIVASWDLLGEDGKPVPLKPDVLRKEVPFSVLNDVLGAIQTHRAEALPGEGKSAG